MTASAGSDKILDLDLASFAATDGAATRSVIVEVEVPNAYASPRPAAKRLVRRGTSRSVGGDKYALASARAMAKFEALLDQLGLLPHAVKLPTAASFVLDVGPGDLRALCESPLVAAIRPNRMHRVGARG